MKKQAFSLIKFLVGWPLSFLALYFLGLRVVTQLSTVGNTIHSLHPSLLLGGIISFLLYFLLRGIVWNDILHGLGYHIPNKKSLFLWTTSELKRYIPGNFWSFLGRSIVFSAEGVSKKHIATSLIFEALLIVIGSFYASFLTIPFVINKLFAGSTYHLLIITSIQIILLLSIILFLVRDKLILYLPKKKQSMVHTVLPDFSFKTNLQLLALSTLSFFFLGIGYYLSILSFMSLPLQHLWSLISFFSLTYLLGYLSLITPSGLGVREGVMSWGLSSFISFSAGGLAAILSRVVLIVVELIFLLGVWLYHTIEYPWIRTAEKWLVKYRYEIVLCLLGAVYVWYFTAASFFRYDNFFTGRFDLGNMTQTVWNTAHGRIFQLTNPDGTEVVSRLATHADFILVLFAPFYYLWASPKVLLFFQTFILACGAYFVYKIAFSVLKRKPIAFIFASIYLLNPSIQWTNLYDFHAVTLATTFLLGAFYYCRSQKYSLFLLFALLAAFTKEQIWAIIAIFGLYIVFFQKKYLLGSVVFALCVGVFYFLSWHAIPSAAGSKHFALSYFSDDITSPTQLIEQIIFSPQKTIATLLRPDRIDFLQQLFAPLGFLSFLAPLYLFFTGPDMAINLLSNKSELHQIYYQYTATITPFLFIAAIMGLNFLFRVIPKRFYSVFGVLLVGSALISAYFYGPLPGMKKANTAMFTKQLPDRKIIQQRLDTIPKNLSVAATNNLGSHLSHREKIFTIPVGLNEADVLAFLLNDQFAQPSLDAQKKMVADLKQNNNYQLVYEMGDFVVFKKTSVTSM